MQILTFGSKTMYNEFCPQDTGLSDISMQATELCSSQQFLL